MQKKIEIIERYPSVEIDKYQYEGPMEEALNIARHYGFSLVRPIKELQKISGPKNYLSSREKKVVFEKIISENRAENLKNNKIKYIMACHSKTGGQENEFHLNIFNEKKSIAEAITIKTIFEILNEQGHKNMIIVLNSLGDKKMRSVFRKDFMSYYKKKSSLLCSACKNRFEKGQYKMFECNAKKCEEIREKAPKPICYLSEQDRRHFKELVEYLEGNNVPYIIDENLVGDIFGNSQIIFQICEIISDGDISSRKILARGERYSQQFLSSKLKNIPSVHASVIIKSRKNKEKYQTLNTLPKKRQPKIYFVQLGFEAKLMSFKIIENLRKNSIFIISPLIDRGLSEQIADAKLLGVSHLMIMGVKEVNDKTIILRDISTYKQEAVNIDNLCVHIKKVVK